MDPTLPATRQTSPPNPSASPDRIDQLFAHLATAFGTLWLSRWTGLAIPAVKADWRAQLACFSDEAVHRAYESIKRDGAEFPPTLPQFVALCMQFDRRGPHTLVALPDHRRAPPPNGFQSLKDLVGKMKP